MSVWCWNKLSIVCGKVLASQQGGAVHFVGNGQIDVETFIMGAWFVE